MSVEHDEHASLADAGERRRPAPDDHAPAGGRFGPLLGVAGDGDTGTLEALSEDLDVVALGREDERAAPAGLAEEREDELEPGGKRRQADDRALRGERLASDRGEGKRPGPGRTRRRCR